MALPEELVSQLVKTINNRGRNNQNYTVYGTVKTDGTRNYVTLDGSDINTPIETTVEISSGDRVVVEVKNHTATVTGNLTDPSIGTKSANGLMSSITQTVEEIRLEVSNELAGMQSTITQHSDSITTLVTNQNEFSEFKQTVEGFSFMGKGGTVKIGNGDINLTGAIRFTDLADYTSVQADIDDAISTADSAYSRATSARTAANEALDTVGSWAHTDDGTYIDGSMIYSESIYADQIHLGGWLKVYKTKKGSTIGGYLGYDSGFGSTYGIGMQAYNSDAQCVCTDEGARLSWGAVSQFFADDYGVSIVGATAIAFELDGYNFLRMADDYFAPYSNGYASKLGHSSTPWDTVYANTTTIQTSDRNLKKDIENLPEKYIIMYDLLRPVRFKLIKGTSDRYHIGYIAQEVEEAMIQAGIDSKEFGGFVRDKDEDGNDIYMLRYGEFDGIRDLKIKLLEEMFTTELTQLKAELAALKEVNNE